jgi:hypothetical protein
MSSASLVSSTVQHIIPDDFEIPRSRPWEALKIQENYPYILTVDASGAASILWTLESGEAKVVTTLRPPLSRTIRFPGTDNHKFIISATHGVVVLFFHEPQGKRGPVDVARTYSLHSGEMIQELELAWKFTGQPLVVCDDTLALTVEEIDRRPKVIIYSLSDTGLEQVREISTDLPDGRTAGTERLIPLHLEDDGSLLTSSTSFPSNTLDLRLRDQHTSIHAIHPAADYIQPGPIVRIQNSIVVAVTEAEFNLNLSPEHTTIHMLNIADLSSRWKTPLPHKVTQMTYHPKLKALVVLGWNSRKIDGPEEDSEPIHLFTVTFLDQETGNLLTEREFPHHGGEHSLRAKCTENDELVVVFETGNIFISPLEAILRTGLPLSENGQLVTQPSPVRPEPYNTKAAKAGERWRWVQDVAVGLGNVVLFPLRGPEFFVVGW